MHLGGNYASIIKESDLIVLNYVSSAADTETRSGDFTGSQSTYGGYIFPFTLNDKHWLSIYGGYSEGERIDIAPELDIESDGWFVGLEWGREIYAKDGYFIDVVVATTWRSIGSLTTLAGFGLSDLELTYNVWTLGLDFYGPSVDSFNGFTSFKLKHDFSRAGKFGSDREEDFLRFDANAEGSFGRFELALERHQRLFDGEFSPGKLLIVAKVNGQHSDDSVVLWEQKYVGGAYTVRGYTEREFFGDSGLHASLELISPIWMKPSFETRLFVKVFIDYGNIRIHTPISGQDKSQDIAGTGCGFQFRIGRRLNAEIDFAYPLEKTFTSRSGVAHAALSLLF